MDSQYATDGRTNECPPLHHKCYHTIQLTLYI